MAVKHEEKSIKTVLRKMNKEKIFIILNPYNSRNSAYKMPTKKYN